MILGKDWHSACLRCDTCDVLLTPGQHSAVSHCTHAHLLTKGRFTIRCNSCPDYTYLWLKIEIILALLHTEPLHHTVNLLLHTHTCAHTYILIYMHTSPCTYTTRIHTCTYTSVCLFECVYVLMCVCWHMCMCMCCWSMTNVNTHCICKCRDTIISHCRVCVLQLSVSMICDQCVVHVLSHSLNNQNSVYLSHSFLICISIII